MNGGNKAWLLLDGALMDGSAAASELCKQPEAVALYRDLGEEAARVGPWLIPSGIDIDSQLAGWRAEREDADFGIAWLHATSSTDELIAHLHCLRYVSAYRQPSKRYFLRYADQRGMTALWPTLYPAQQKALLGPVKDWSWRSLDGIEVTLTASSVDSDVALPLHLRVEQFHAMTEEAALGDLVVATGESFPEFVTQHTLAQRYTATRSARDWCVSHEINAVPWRMAVVLATARHDGRNLLDASFADTTQRARAEDDMSLILAWAAASGPVTTFEKTA